MKYSCHDRIQQSIALSEVEHNHNARTDRPGIDGINVQQYLGPKRNTQNALILICLYQNLGNS